MRDKIQLSLVADLIMGQSPDSTFCNQIQEGLPFLQGCGEFGKKYPIVVNYCTQPKKISPKNSILISVRAPVGDLNIADKDFVIGRGLAGIVAKNIDNDFLFYSISNFKRQLKRVSQGSTFEAINSKELQEFEINNFPLPQQRKIAQILTTCDAVIEKTEAAIVKYQAIKQGLMHDLFTRGIDMATGKLRPKQEDAPQLYKQSELGWIPKEWEVKKLGLDNNTYAGGTPNRSIEEYFKGNIPWVTSGEVNQDFIYKTKESITNNALNYSSAKMAPKESVLVALYGATAGQISMLKIDACTNQAVLAIIPSDKWNNYFIYYSLNYSKERIIFLAQGSGQPNLNKNMLDNLNLWFPSINEQKEIIKRIIAIDKKLQTEQSALSKYQQLKTGLMQDLLSGKVEVRVDTVEIF